MPLIPKNRKWNRGLPMTRVSTRDFQLLESRTHPYVGQMKSEIHGLIALMKRREDAEQAELSLRNGLEDVREEIIQWFMDTFSISRKALSNFPSLDALLYHQDGWNLHDTLFDYYEQCCKNNDKAGLKDAIYRIIDVESKRLITTIFDSLNERGGMFAYVTTTGDPDCDEDTGICRKFYGTFRVGVELYQLPPYHPKCDCYAIYHDNKELD